MAVGVKELVGDVTRTEAAERCALCNKTATLRGIVDVNGRLELGEFGRVRGEVKESSGVAEAPRRWRISVKCEGKDQMEPEANFRQRLRWEISAGTALFGVGRRDDRFLM